MNPSRFLEGKPCGRKPTSAPAVKSRVQETELLIKIYSMSTGHRQLRDFLAHSCKSYKDQPYTLDISFDIQGADSQDAGNHASSENHVHL